MEQKAWIIDEKTAKQYLTVEDAIDCVEKTWKWYGEGRVIMPNKITTDMSELGVAGWFNSMPAYIGPMDVAGIKVVGGYDGNKALGLPYIKANVLITDSKTGILRALISGDHINDLRTGAQPAVMARLLAAKTDVVTIIGTGLQGYMSLLCMSKVLDMKEIRVCDISEAAMDRFIARFPDAPFRFVKCKSNEEGCRGSDVIITVTNANADLVEEPWVKPGALVMTMGSFRETSFDVVRKADRIAVDQVLRSRAGSGTFVSERAPTLLQTQALAGIMADPAALRELVQARYILEPQLAQMAAQAATEEEIRGLFAILDRMKRGQTRFELMSVGHQFHLSLAQLAHNRVLYGFYVSAASQMRSMRVLESLTLEVYRSGIHEHAAIAEAIAHRDGALAAQRMREHLQNDYGPYLSELTAPQP